MNILILIYLLSIVISSIGNIFMLKDVQYTVYGNYNKKIKLYQLIFAIMISLIPLVNTVIGFVYSPFVIKYIGINYFPKAVDFFNKEIF